ARFAGGGRLTRVGSQDAARRERRGRTLSGEAPCRRGALSGLVQDPLSVAGTRSGCGPRDRGRRVLAPQARARSRSPAARCAPSVRQRTLLARGDVAGAARGLPPRRRHRADSPRPPPPRPPPPPPRPPLPPRLPPP